MTTTEKIRQLIKSVLLGILYYSGIIQIIRHYKMRHSAVILMYHRVIDPHNKPLDYTRGDMIVSKQNFEKQMFYLRKTYQVVSLSELISRLKNKEKFDQKLCVITFDDGWRDIFDIATPILKKYQFPFTVFITTNFVSEGEWDWEQRIKYSLTYLSNIISVKGIETDEILRENIEKLNIGYVYSLNPEQINSMIENEIVKFKQLSMSEIMKFLSSVESIIENLVEKVEIPFVDWEQVQFWFNNGVEIGIHTKSHPNLTNCEPSVIRSEIVDARDCLESTLNSKIATFAYPYGKNNATIRRILEETNISGACTTQLGLVNENTNVYLLNRINIYDDVAYNTPMFAGRILNLFNFS